MKKFLRTVFLMAVLAVMAAGSAQAATVVTTETALKSAISSGASEIEFGGHITLTSLSGISISNQTLTIDLKGYSLNGMAGTNGTDGADSSTNGKDGTAGTIGEMCSPYPTST
ncbi:hypothetical protein RFF05_17800 [Bengtsoniella intestinalis]|uniref:hypothetical protein n=1 Tax=Bengtsoniella intestinalis TaxID=3073143 RepID=UPI00391EF03E